MILDVNLLLLLNLSCGQQDALKIRTDLVARRVKMDLIAATVIIFLWTDFLR